MKYDFTYNGQTIPYEIIHKDVKNINIRIKPSGEVVISCNPTIDNKIIELELIKRAKWITKSIENFKLNTIEFRTANLKLVDGEAFLLFGKILRIQNVESDKFYVDFDNNYLYIHRTDNRGIKEKFHKWYMGFATRSFTEMVDKTYKKFEKYGIAKPKVSFKNMKTLWGSCNVKNKTISLNIQLMKVDPFLTEYVICHELSHLRYRNHNRDFYNFLTTILPDWKEREEILHNIFINKNLKSGTEK